MKSSIQAYAAVTAIILLNVGGLAAEPARITVDGRERTYIIERPNGQGPHPTMVVLHGLNGTGAAMARATGLDRLAPESGFVAVFPDRQPPLLGWNFFPPGKELPALIERSRPIGGPPDDVSFLKALVADLVRRGISDPARIYLAGNSNGSFMTLRMVCAEARVFAAVAVLAGGMPDVVGNGCRPAKPMPFLTLNGTADTTVPYVGGPVFPGGLFSAWPTERLVGFFRSLNGCAEKQERWLLPNTSDKQVEVLRWTNCADSPVVFYRVIGGDHGAPWNSNVNVGALLLDFFRGKRVRT